MFCSKLLRAFWAIPCLLLTTNQLCCKTAPDKPRRDTVTASTLILSATTRKIAWERPPDGSVVAAIQALRAKPEQRGRTLLLYVGASWCEPCQRFHQAVERGELDIEFPTLTLLEFDADRDLPRLRDAGYASEFIPLFARPGDDGRASARQFSGSIKGDGAVANIVPKLKSLLSP
jgi:thiol-disulfide isomerase/thioredoxin